MHHAVIENQMGPYFFNLFVSPLPLPSLNYLAAGVFLRFFVFCLFVFFFVGFLVSFLFVFCFCFCIGFVCIMCTVVVLMGCRLVISRIFYFNFFF